MAVGDVTRVRFETVPDPDTGVGVTRLTDDSGDSIVPYFHQVNFTDDEKGLLVSSNRTGEWQAYLLGLDTQELVQLTDEPDGIGPHSATILPGKRKVGFVGSGRSANLVNLDGSEKRTLYQVPPGFHMGQLATSADGASVTFYYSEDLALSTVTGRIYSGMNETLYRRPTSLLVRVDTESGAATALWGEREWFGHVNVSPVDSDIVLFCHEGPWHLVQRMWVLRASTGEIWPLVKQKRLLERSGHEFFTKSGRVVTQYSWRFHPGARDWISMDVFIQPDGSQPQSFRYLCGSPGHVYVARDETLGVGDSAFPTEDFREGRSYMSLIRYQNERAVMTPLCRHDSSWKTQHSHPHPVFSPDDQYVYFNTDRGGRSNIYRAPTGVEGL